jgi:hypothetical protein
MSAQENTRVETWTMHGPRGEPVQVEVRFNQFVGDTANYWLSGQAEDGEVVVPGKNGTFEKGDGTILTFEGGRDFEYRIRHNS